MKSPVAINRIPVARKRQYESRLNRENSAWRLRLMPPISVLLASCVQAMPIITAQPILPPLGLMVFLGWRLMRPGIWPTWAGLPLGLFDDIMSGQPLGSSAFTWSIIMLAIEYIDYRSIWRDYVQDWLVAGIMIVFSIVAGWWFVSLAHKAPAIQILGPQIILSLLLYPLTVRFCAGLDRWRLAT